MYKVTVQDRNESLDLLRVLLCTAVIITHTCSYLLNIKAYNSLIWCICVCISSINMIAVPCFFILSGFFLLDNNKVVVPNNFYLKSLKKIVLPFIIWSIVYCLYDLQIWNFSFFLYNLNYDTIIQKLVSGPSHLWFLFYLINYYIMVPFFRNLCNNKDLFFLYFIIVLVFQFILPYFKYLPYISIISTLGDRIGITNFFGFSIYFLSGSLLRKNMNYFNNRKKILVILFAISISLIPIFTIVSSFLLNQKNYIFQNYLSIEILFSSTIFFYWFYRKYKLNNIILKKISLLSKYTFSAYLSHILIVNLGIIFGIYSLNISAYIQLVLHIIFSVIGTFLLSILIDKIKTIRRHSR